MYRFIRTAYLGVLAASISSAAFAQIAQQTHPISIDGKAVQLRSYTERAVVGDNGQGLPPPDTRVELPKALDDICHNLEPKEREANPLCKK
jgi:hypothetical protein